MVHDVKERSRGTPFDDLNASLRTRSIDSLFWSVVRVLTLIGLRFGVLMILARLLAPEEFGLMSAALIVFSISGLFYQLGLGAAIIQRRNLTTSHIRSGVTGSVLVSLLVGGVVVIAAPGISGFFDFEGLTPILRVVALEFPFAGISAIARALMERDLRFRELAAVDASAYAAGYGVVGISLALTGAGVWALVIAHLVTSAISAVVLLTIQRQAIRPGFQREAFRDLMVFGGGDTVAKVFGALAGQGDNIVAGRWLGASALGIYGRAFQLVVFPVSQMNLIVNQVLFSAMSKLQDSSERLAVALRRGSTITAAIYSPMSMVMVVLAPEVVLVVLGPNWTNAIVPLRILALGMTFRAGYQMGDAVSRASGAVYRRAWRQGIFAAAVLLGAWIGQFWGLAGLSFGVLIALGINYILMSWLALSLTSLDWKRFAGAHLPGVRLGFVAISITWLIASGIRSLDAPDLVTLVAAPLSTALSLGILIRSVPKVMGPDREWLYGVLRETIRGRFRNPQPEPESAQSDD